MIFFDTSVMVCAAHRADLRYRASLECLSSTTSGSGCCGAPSLAEMFSVLTGRPHPMRMPIVAAHALVEQIRNRLKVVALNENEYLNVVRESASAGYKGGSIFDALLVACARKAKAETIYTWNVRQFRLVAPDLAARIMEPGG